jgi:hypothetical protein
MGAEPIGFAPFSIWAAGLACRFIAPSQHFRSQHFNSAPLLISIVRLALSGAQIAPFATMPAVYRLDRLNGRVPCQLPGYAGNTRNSGTGNLLEYAWIMLRKPSLSWERRKRYSP